MADTNETGPPTLDAHNGRDPRMQDGDSPVPKIEEDNVCGPRPQLLVRLQVGPRLIGIKNPVNLQDEVSSAASEPEHVTLSNGRRHCVDQITVKREQKEQPMDGIVWGDNVVVPPFSNDKVPATVQAPSNPNMLFCMAPQAAPAHRNGQENAINLLCTTPMLMNSGHHEDGQTTRGEDADETSEITPSELADRELYVIDTEGDVRRTQKEKHAVFASKPRFQPSSEILPKPERTEPSTVDTNHTRTPQAAHVEDAPEAGESVKSPQQAEDNDVFSQFINEDGTSPPVRNDVGTQSIHQAGSTKTISKAADAQSANKISTTQSFNENSQSASAPNAFGVTPRVDQSHFTSAHVKPEPMDIEGLPTTPMPSKHRNGVDLEADLEFGPDSVQNLRSSPRYDGPNFDNTNPTSSHVDSSNTNKYGSRPVDRTSVQLPPGRVDETEQRWNERLQIVDDYNRYTEQQTQRAEHEKFKRHHEFLQFEQWTKQKQAETQPRTQSPEAAVESTQDPSDNFGTRNAPTARHEGVGLDAEAANSALRIVQFPKGIQYITESHDEHGAYGAQRCNPGYVAMNYNQYAAPGGRGYPIQPPPGPSVFDQNSAGDAYHGNRQPENLTSKQKVALNRALIAERQRQIAQGGGLRPADPVQNGRPRSGSSAGLAAQNQGMAGYGQDFFAPSLMHNEHGAAHPRAYSGHTPSVPMSNIIAYPVDPYGRMLSPTPHESGFLPRPLNAQTSWWGEDTLQQAQRVLATQVAYNSNFAAQTTPRAMSAVSFDSPALATRPASSNPTAQVPNGTPGNDPNATAQQGRNRFGFKVLSNAPINSNSQPFFIDASEEEDEEDMPLAQQAQRIKSTARQAPNNEIALGLPSAQSIQQANIHASEPSSAADKRHANPEAQPPLEIAENGEAPTKDQGSSDDDEDGPISWTLPKFEVLSIPPASKNDNHQAKVSIPGIVREEILLDATHWELEVDLFVNVFLPMQRMLGNAPDNEPAHAILNFHTIAVLAIEAFVNYEVGEITSGGLDLARLNRQIRKDGEFERIHDAREASSTDMYFACVDRWRAGLESDKKPFAMIRGAAEFSDGVIPIIDYIIGNGLVKEKPKKPRKPRSEKGKRRKQAEDDTDAEDADAGLNGVAAGTKVNTVQPRKKLKTDTTPTKKCGKVAATTKTFAGPTKAATSKTKGKSKKGPGVTVTVQT